MNNEYISFHHLSKKFQNDLVLKDISAVLHRGEILGFLGPSGAGKTTTIKILTGQLLPTSGEAKVLGKRCQDIDESIYEQIGIVTDQSGIYERLSVYDNLKYFARLLNVPLKDIDPLLRRIGLYDHRKKPAGRLSKGQTQRLILARAILHRPKVLFLDEPTSGLDPGERVRFRNLLSEFAKDRIVVISTHIVSDVEYIANQNAIMKDGKIIENDTTEQLVRLVDGKIWECKIPSSDLVKWERALKLINLRNEADGTTSIRYLSDQAETPDSVSAVPRLEDLYLWLFPQEGEVRL